MSEKRCIFDNTIDCGRFTNGKYVCIIFRKKCENLKYGVVHLDSKNGELTNLAFIDNI